MDTNNNLELLVQKRISTRQYVFDYHAFIRDTVTQENDLFGEGGGLSANLEEAKIRAIGEAVERYGGSHINKRIFKQPYWKVKKNAINPQEFIYFSNNQYCKEFPYRKYNQKKQIDWLTAFSLTQNRKILVPAFATYLGYNRTVSKGEYLTPSSSCGLASHISTEKAKNSAVFEIIERDAAIMTWYLKKKIPRIGINSIKYDRFVYLRNKITEEGLKIEICVTPNDFSILSVIAVIYNIKKQIPYASFGMAAGPNIENVLVKSLEEALMVRNTLEIFKKEKKIKKINITDINNYIEHAIYYSSPSKRKMWHFLFTGPIIPIESLNLHLDANTNYKKIVNLLRENKKEAIFVNLTTKLIKRMGLCCVKVIIPSLHPMDFNHNTRFLRGIFGNKKINNNPHPFA